MKYSVVYNSDITPASVITTQDLKLFLRVDHSEEDTLIEALRLAAINYIEQYCNVRLGQVTATMHLDKFPLNWEVPINPVQSVDSITYTQAPGVEVTLSTSNYYVDTNRKPARIAVINTPSVYDYTFNGVTINLTLGYNESEVPAPIVHAIRLLVGHYYEQRQESISGTIITNIPSGIHSLLNPYRVISDR